MSINSAKTNELASITKLARRRELTTEMDPAVRKTDRTTIQNIRFEIGILNNHRILRI